MTSKGTPRRTLRISDDIWDPAEARAGREGRKLVDAIREFLTRYGQDDDNNH